MPGRSPSLLFMNTQNASETRTIFSSSMSAVRRRYGSFLQFRLYIICGAACENSAKVIFGDFLFQSRLRLGKHLKNFFKELFLAY